MSHEFILRPPPKAAERNTYGEEYIKNLVKLARAKKIGTRDLVRTATQFVAESIAINIRRFLLPEGRTAAAIVCGGGAYNPFLLECLAQSLSGIKVATTRGFGFDPKAVEAIGFALLAYETFHGRPGNLPRVTGAQRPVVLGCIYPASA